MKKQINESSFEFVTGEDAGTRRGEVHPLPGDDGLSSSSTTAPTVVDDPSDPTDDDQWRQRLAAQRRRAGYE